MRSLSLWRPRVDNGVGARPARGTSVKDDWRAWLPEHKEQIFRVYVRQLEIQYNMFSISLDEALQLRQGGRFAKAGQAVCVTPELCSRFAHPWWPCFGRLGSTPSTTVRYPTRFPWIPRTFKAAAGSVPLASAACSAGFCSPSVCSS